MKNQNADSKNSKIDRRLTKNSKFVLTEDNGVQDVEQFEFTIEQINKK